MVRDTSTKASRGAKARIKSSTSGDKASGAPTVRSRTNDPERTKEGILREATIAFARDGLNGSRVDEIAELTHTSKRMIYYYFDSKEGLYREVLERCYARIRSQEEQMGLEAYEPEDALARLIRFTFDYHRENPEFVRLVMVENIHRGEYVKDLFGLHNRGAFAMELLGQLLSMGVKRGVFREGIDPLELHMSITALCFYNVSNRYTVEHVLDHNMADEENAERRVKNITDLILAWCRKG